MSDSKNSELIEQGQPLVYSLAAKIHRSIPVRVDLDDLIAYGELGLAEAARDFDPEVGARFTTFAYYRIRGAIYDGLSQMSWTSRARWRKLRYEQLANEALREDEANAGSRDGSLQGQANWLSGITEKLAVIYLTTSGDDGKGIRDSSIPDPSASSAAGIVAQREIVERIHGLIEKLPREDARLIQMVYFDGTTLQEAADKLGVHKSSASRRHAKALETLAKALRRMGASP